MGTAAPPPPLMGCIIGGPWPWARLRVHSQGDGGVTGEADRACPPPCASMGKDPSGGGGGKGKGGHRPARQDQWSAQAEQGRGRGPAQGQVHGPLQGQRQGHGAWAGEGQAKEGLGA